MIAAVKDLSSSGTDVAASTKTGEYLDACNLLFEQGLLSHHRVNNKDSSVLENIKKGMSFFEQWCANHENTGNLLPEYNVSKLLNVKNNHNFFQNFTF